MSAPTGNPPNPMRTFRMTVELKSVTDEDVSRCRAVLGLEENMPVLTILEQQVGAVLAEVLPVPARIKAEEILVFEGTLSQEHCSGEKIGPPVRHFHRDLGLEHRHALTEGERG